MYKKLSIQMFGDHVQQLMIKFMSNGLKLFIFFLISACLSSCKENNDFTAITYPEMNPGMQVNEIITGNPGEDIHITAQLADIHGLKRITISSESLPLEYSIDLENKTTYLLDYIWTIPENTVMGSQHIINIITQGNTQTVTKQIQLLASKATDYEVMYVAYEDETEELWEQCLNKQALPRKMQRDAPYNYSITLYSPGNETKISLLGQKGMLPDIYGINPDNPEKVAFGEKYLTLPGEGYYKISVNLQTCVYSMDKITPALQAYELYILGDLINSGWNFEEGKNDMERVYENNPYLVRRSLKFKDAEGGIKFANKDWSVQINPLSGYTSWEDMGKWAIIDWDNNQTKDIWLPTPGGFYEVTLDYFLGELTIIATEENVTEDYAQMYVAYEDEVQADWENALTGLPRIAKRSAPYTYSIDIYSPAASTQIKFIADTNIASDGYGENGQKGTFIKLPDEGYYHVDINLDTKTTQIEKITPTISKYDKIYIVGSLTESAWNFNDAVNLMQVVYSKNPYLLSKDVNFTSTVDGDLVFSTADWTMWKPLKECSTWSEIKNWEISNGSNTQDIWWKAPTGKYEATFDYYLGKVILIKK